MRTLYRDTHAHIVDHILNATFAARSTGIATREDFSAASGIGDIGWQLLLAYCQCLDGFWRHYRLFRFGLVDHHGLAVEIRVSKQTRGALEIHDGEVELLVVLAQAGAATDDLLELGHRVDVLVQHDELAGFGIHSGGEQLGGGGDDRVKLVVVDEVGKLSLAFVVVTSDAHHVTTVASSSGYELDQLLPHPLGVILIVAKHDGFSHWVSSFEVFPHFAGHEPSALF